MASRRAVIAFKVGFVALSVVLALLITGFILEGYYTKRADDWKSKLPNFARLVDKYAPFAPQHVHPVYGFFLPFDLKYRKSLNNDVVSVDDAGFRGPDPSQAGGRKLAFLTGGSSVFGVGSSSNMTTISGYLNQLQDEYFFVNAGVCSWISTQELHRVAFQLLGYKPALIVAINGVNDVSVATEYRDAGLDYEVGYPQSFDKLYEFVGDIEGEAKERHTPWYRRWYPTLSERWFGPQREPTPIPYPPDLYQRIANRYALNMNLMNAMSNSMGARFVGVFQPMCKIEDDWTKRLLTAHKLMVAQPYNFEYHDFKDVFDRYYQKLPPVSILENVDTNKETVFIDCVHVTDVGAKLIAQELLRVVLKK